MSSVTTERYTPLYLKDSLDVISCSLSFHREDQATLRLTPGPELSLQPQCFHEHPYALLSCAQALATGGKRQTPSAPPRCTLAALDATPSRPTRLTPHSHTGGRCWELRGSLATASTQLRPGPEGWGGHRDKRALCV